LEKVRRWERFGVQKLSINGEETAQNCCHRANSKNLNKKKDTGRKSDSEEKFEKGVRRPTEGRKVQSTERKINKAK
jgi:hypothetical protein